MYLIGKAVVKAVRATEEKKDDTKNKKHGGASRKHHASRSLVITNHTSHYLSLFKNVGVEAPLELGEIESALAQLAARVEFFNNATTEESAPKEATVKSKSEHRTTLKEFMKEASEPPKDENTPQIKIIDPKEAEVDPNHLTYAEVEQSTH